MKPQGLSKNRPGVSLPTHLLTRLKPQKWLPLALFLAGLTAILLPLNLLYQQRFHHDEALYATWALEIASGRNVWLAQTPIDKPPLFLYILAGTMRLLGPTETVARLPSLLATVVTVGLTFWLGRRLYGGGVGLLAAWLVALSPFTILFAPTAFTDPLLVALVLTGCVAAASGRAGWAGVGLGLAIATKQQAFFFAPLVVGLMIVAGGREQVAGNRSQVTSDTRQRQVTGDKSHVLLFTDHASRSPLYPPRFTLSAPRATLPALRSPLPALLTFCLTLLLTLIPLFVWEAARRQSPGLWQLSLANYGGLTASVGSFGERWVSFLELLQYATASSLLNAVFLIGLPLLLLYDLWQIRPTSLRSQPTSQPSTPPSDATNQLSSPPTNHPSNQPANPACFDWLLFLFGLGYLLGHAWFSFQVWDRYLLGLIPLLALLLARVLLWPWLIMPRHWLDHQPNLRSIATLGVSLLLVGLLVTTMASPVQDAVNGRYPLGSHSQALQGLEQIVAYLRGHIGANHTLYHRWLGPHWRFYLWDYPYDLQYWQSPEELAISAKPGHLIALPAWQSDTAARLALAEAGLGLRELTRAYHPAGYPSIILYQIEQIADKKLKQ